MKMLFLKKTLTGVFILSVASLSIDLSLENGVVLGIKSAHAVVGRPLTPVSGAGVARRQVRRSTYVAPAATYHGQSYYHRTGAVHRCVDRYGRYYTCRY